MGNIPISVYIFFFVSINSASLLASLLERYSIIFTFFPTYDWIFVNALLYPDGILFPYTIQLCIGDSDFLLDKRENLIQFINRTNLFMNFI